MANVEEGSFELQQKRWTELINLRQTIADHDMDPAGVDLAISNVFESSKGPLIDAMISDGKCLVTLMIQLNALGIDANNVKMALVKAFVPGMSGAYDAGLLRLKELIKMREQMAKMGIPTGCIEATMAEVFRVSQFRMTKKTLLIESVTIVHCNGHQAGRRAWTARCLVMLTDGGDSRACGT